MSAFLSSDSPFYKELSPRSYSVVTEKEHGKDHTVFDDAPCEWSKARGATHTLYCGDGQGKGTRPAILKKTVMFVGTNEIDNNIVWEKWNLISYKTLRFIK